ncbi:MAG: hypothetical protein OZ921_19645 [Sorangiineae bacterium]|nr:hypothetical protein [Polyangiaceae bacterium]MEB2324739.1 hypothetical protein [Sorangiineae bacterium]
MSALRLAVAAALALGASGCPAPPSPEASDGAASATPAATPRPSAPPPPRAAAPPRTLGARCRALSVSGAVTMHGGAALAEGAPLDGRSWVELADGARLTVRHADSARELTLTGPATATLCSGGEEQVRLTRGRLTTAAGRGARPGAEVLVATPIATLTYGEAQLELRVEPMKVEARVRSGDAWLEPAGGAVRTGPAHLEAGGRASVVARPRAAASALEDCQAAAREAQARGREVLAPPPEEADAGALGDRAARHVRAREAARRLCAVAGAALGLTPDPEKRRAEWAELEAADRLWRQVPVPPR